MNFDLTDDQKMLQDQARRFLSGRVDYDRLRELVTRDETLDASLWREAVELGWPAVAIPESHGGLGLGILELCVLVEEAGRSVASLPLVSSMGLAAETIVRLGSEEQKQQWLPRLASGEAIGAFAQLEGPGDPAPASLSAITTCLVEGRLHGRKWPVLDASAANLLVVIARDPDGGVGAYLTESGQEGVSLERLQGFDQLRAGWAVSLDGARAERLAGDVSVEALGAILDLGAVLTAFEQIGGADAALEMSRRYALERKAFGRAIGSFQAIKHKLADMLTKIELARSNAFYAGWAIENDAPDRAAAAAAARLSATDAYEFAARENMQVHGGISFTWEANCHFHFRRSRLLALVLGGTSFWSDRLIDQLVSMSPSPATAS